LYREGTRAPITLAADSPAMRIIQQVRDEAHRFAITGHRQRRTRSSRQSGLETIPGLGPRRRRALLQHLGGLQEISRAGIDDLARVPGISRTLAARIYGHLHEDAVP
jgi:excinuclease ABC subunit C